MLSYKSVNEDGKELVTKIWCHTCARHFDKYSQRVIFHSPTAPLAHLRRAIFHSPTAPLAHLRRAIYRSPVIFKT